MIVDSITILNLSHFFDDMHAMSFEELEGKYAAPIKYSLKTRAKRKVKKIIKSMLRVIGGQKVNNADYGLLFVFNCEE